LFVSDERLVNQDTNGVQDLYERSPGEIKLVSIETVPPQTTITSGPAGQTNDPTPTFTFSASEAGSSFECRLDSGSFSPCGSTKTTAHLADGAHTLRVRAKDRAGNVDPTPATRSFTVDGVDIGVSGSTLVVAAGGGAKDNLKITRPSQSTVRVTDFAGGAYTGSGVQAGPGCSRSGGYTVNCSAAGITLIEVFSQDRNDQIINSTTIQASLDGGGANDTVIGGGANDTISGGTGVDVMKGRNGNDLLLARDSTSDTAVNCDGGAKPGGADVAEVDELPHDPDSAITRCETVSRG
jgi:hypothetical protein